MLVILLASSILRSSNLSIAPCIYESDTTAQAAWQAYDGALAAKASTKGVILPFNTEGNHPRAFWDRALNIDLSRVDRINFDFYISDTSQISPTFNCYFQADGGWYTASFPAEKGWSHISLSKSSFHVEESPRGWNHITAFRVGGWKSVDGTGEMGIAHIEAESSDIAVVLGDKTKPNSPEFGTVQSQTQTVTKILEDAGIPCGGLTDSDIEAGALQGRKVAIFPHNPDMSDKEMDEIEQFVQSGGRVIGFYTVHPRLMRLIGAEVTGWKKSDPPGLLSSLHFNNDRYPGMPDEVKQSSWNTNVIQPSRADASVIAEWRTSIGAKTGLPAWIASPRGAYMSHVLLGDDPKSKGQMMLALLGHFNNDLWKSAYARTRINSIRVGPFTNIEETKNPLGPNVYQQLSSTLMRADEAASKQDYFNAIKHLHMLKDELILNYCAHLPSKPNEMRAAWCHSAFGVNGRSWDSVLKALVDNGFNAIFPNMLWGGRAYYPSKILPVDETIAQRGDQIAECLEAAHRWGIKVHVWKVDWNLTNAPSDFLATMRQQKRTQKDPAGKDLDWLCPSNPKNFELERDSLLEVVRNYKVDGIHFDYIRYPGSEGCYCDGCRSRFEDSAEIRVKNWPADVISGDLRQKYQEFRRANITRLVRTVSKEARKIRPGVQISAAVFADWPLCRDTVGQDWVTWVKEGSLDFACPMDYTASATQYDQWMTSQSKALGKPYAFRPGIGATLDSSMTPDQVAWQVQIGRSHGSSGFILFNLEEALLRDCLPSLHLGISK